MWRFDGQEWLGPLVISESGSRDALSAELRVVRLGG